MALYNRRTKHDASTVKTAATPAHSAYRSSTLRATICANATCAMTGRHRGKARCAQPFAQHRPFSMAHTRSGLQPDEQGRGQNRSEEHTSELQSRGHLV